MASVKNKIKAARDRRAAKKKRLRHLHTLYGIRRMRRRSEVRAWWEHRRQKAAAKPDRAKAA